MDPILQKLLDASEDLFERMMISLDSHKPLTDKKREWETNNHRQHIDKCIATYEKHGIKELKWELKDWDGCKGKPQVWVHHISKKKTLTLFTWDMERGIHGCHSDGRPNGNGYGLFLPGLNMEEAKLAVYAKHKLYS